MVKPVIRQAGQQLPHDHMWNVVAEVGNPQEVLEKDEHLDIEYKYNKEGVDEIVVKFKKYGIKI